MVSILLVQFHALNSSEGVRAIAQKKTVPLVDAESHKADFDDAPVDDWDVDLNETKWEAYKMRDGAFYLLLPASSQ